ncbi:Signal peptide, CUB and EGF-like domain-containing protein 1 [Liparis tanakae]|uniref:Signal peptide, CUB and EGF-like domain-containing protein 1 n=1 Tax=Liparis tanakae TaxID=230148 RepID=A0A4Z2DYZ8_9TELE|nr:Signal peptide, CUB and EGF-like domain-containing protein 1 [Liparis tanakae]
MEMKEEEASDACDVDCVRERVKQKLQSAMRTLRKSINKQQFYIQFSGTDGAQEQCVQCPPGTYQDTVGQLSCEPCPSTEAQGVAGAKNVSQCGGESPDQSDSVWR